MIYFVVIIKCSKVEEPEKKKYKHPHSKLLTCLKH